ncbi:sigma-70 family RNA polymerase sigma factor [Neobacillus rhizosphaerae]|uniref:sigma-70 family RNA polymerase sigma factor n=1 Tax=Neobacillus rhizosphaerae TaxID=2880965 RepID=UPI003D2907B4
MDSFSSHFTQDERVLKGLLEGSDEAWYQVTKQGLKDVKRSMKRYDVTNEDAEDILQNAIVEFFKALKKNEGAIENLVHFAASVWKKRVFAATNKAFNKEQKDRDAQVQSGEIEVKEEEADSYSLYEKIAYKNNHGNEEENTIIRIVVEDFLNDYTETNKKIFKDQLNGKTFVQTEAEINMSRETIKSRFRKMKQSFQAYYIEGANI